MRPVEDIGVTAASPFRAFPVLCILTIVLFPSAHAQRPAIQTVDAPALGSGMLEIAVGADYAVKNRSVPGSDMNRLLRLFPFEARFGVAHNVDITVGWRGRLVARAENGTAFSDWGDPYLSTKVVLTDTGSPGPAVALFSEVKIPSSRYLPHRLGSDATDVFLKLLLSQTAGEFTVRVNAGLCIIGDPRAPGSQDDIYSGSIAVALPPAGGVTTFVEVYGFTGPRDDDDKLQVAGGFAGRIGPGEILLSGRHKISGTPYDFGTAFESSEAWGVAVAWRCRFSM